MRYIVQLLLGGLLGRWLLLLLLLLLILLECRVNLRLDATGEDKAVTRQGSMPRKHRTARQCGLKCFLTCCSAAAAAAAACCCSAAVC